MKKVEDHYITNANKDQADYYLSRDIHRISRVKIDGREVGFEVILRLEKLPKDYVNLDIFVDRPGVFRRKNDDNGMTESEKEEVRRDHVEGDDSE